MKNQNQSLFQNGLNYTVLSFTCTQSHSPPPTPTHFHLLSSTPPYARQLLSTTTQIDPIALISSPLLSIITLFSPLQLIFSPLLLTPTLVLPTPIQFKPTPAHVQPLSLISSPHPNTLTQSNLSSTIPTHI